MGSPDFSVPTLKALIDNNFKVEAVYCQPPKPKNRGHKMSYCPVHQAALDLNLNVYSPKNFKSDVDLKEFLDLDLDAVIVVAYGLILPKEIIDTPKYGCFNIHASLLPRWRGAAPIQRAILEGDKETGITMMKMDHGLDTGPMISKQQIPIHSDTTAGMLHDQLSLLGSKLCIDMLKALKEKGRVKLEAQPDEGANYAKKISSEEAEINWSEPAEKIERQIRAFTPWPGAWFIDHQGQRLKIFQAKVVKKTQSVANGVVYNDDFCIACGDEAIQPQVIQRPGKKPQNLDDFLRGYPIPAQTVLNVAA